MTRVTSNNIKSKTYLSPEKKMLVINGQHIAHPVSLKSLYTHYLILTSAFWCKHCFHTFFPLSNQVLPPLTDPSSL